MIVAVLCNRRCRHATAERVGDNILHGARADPQPDGFTAVINGVFDHGHCHGGQSLPDANGTEITIEVGLGALASTASSGAEGDGVVCTMTPGKLSAVQGGGNYHSVLTHPTEVTDGVRRGCAIFSILCCAIGDNHHVCMTTGVPACA